MTTYQQPGSPQNNSGREDESIDLIAIAKVLWNGRKAMLYSLGVCFVLGVAIALLTPRKYTVSTVFVPQTNKSGKSSLSSLASMAGIDLGTMSESSELSPLIYPQIVSSVPFKLELMNTLVHFEDVDTAISLYDYYTNYKKPSVLGIAKKYTVGLPGVILGAIRKTPEEVVLPVGLRDGPIQLTMKQDKIKKMLDKQVSLMVEKKEGYLTLTVNMSEPLVAAEVAQKAQAMLQDYITRFKVEKSKAELDFIQERYDAAKTRAESSQYDVAVSTDKYKALTSSVPQIDNTRLQTQYNIENSVYLELAKQLEQAKIQVKKDTPVFTVVEPVAIPTKPSGPSRSKTVVIWIFLGGIIGCGIVYGKSWFQKVKERWQSA